MIPLITEHGPTIVTESYLRRVVGIEDELLTTDDLMALTKFGRKKVLAMLHDGRIPGFKLDGEWRITRRAFRQAADRGFTWK